MSEVRHYQLTLEERIAFTGSYVCGGDDVKQPEMICRTGDGHAKGTRYWQIVTCPHCLAKKPKEK